MHFTPIVRSAQVTRQFQGNTLEINLSCKTRFWMWRQVNLRGMPKTLELGSCVDVPMLDVKKSPDSFTRDCWTYEIYRCHPLTKLRSKLHEEPKIDKQQVLPFLFSASKSLLMLDNPS